jgi:Na+-transporting methylmalonyl-CoA/oxaloacetate decarboxylase gamma subunit
MFVGNLSTTLIYGGRAAMLWIIGFGIYLFLLSIAWLFIRGCSECEHRMSLQFDAIPPYPLLELSKIASFAELESEPYGNWYEETA